MKRSTRALLSGLFCLLLMVPYLPVMPVKAEAQPIYLPDFSEPTDLVAPLDGSPTIYDGATGVEDGVNVLYTTSKGVPAMFNVIDIDSHEILRTLPMVGASDSWAHKVAPDGTVYVTGGKSIWGYSPETKEIESLAELPQSSLWSLAVDEDSNAYAGTFPGGNIFKYDKETKEVRDYGRMIGDISQEYVRSMDYHDGYLYAGTEHKKILRVDVNTGEKVDITPDVDEEGNVYDTDVVDGKYVFSRYGRTENVYIYDIEKEEWLDTILENGRGLHLTDSLDGKVYYTAEGKLRYLDLETFEKHETSMVFGTALRGADWVEFNDDELPGKSLVTIMFDGKVAIFNIDTDTVVIRDSIVPPSANVTSRIFAYSEDKVYVSGMTGAVGAVYNPLTNTYNNFGLGQADAIHEMDGKLYFGVYPSGSVREIDPKVNPNGPTNDLFTIGEDQQRIHHFASGDGKLFVGSIPANGKIGGALTVYDGTDYKVFRNIIQDQSINGLAYQDGILYASTSIYGGLGSEPTTSEAKIFKWDPNTEEILKEVTLDIPGVNSPDRIGSLIADPSGEYIWGSADGVVFALNPETLEVEKYTRMASTQYGSDVQFEWSEDGLLYANMHTNLYVIHPETLQYKFIAPTEAFSISEDGNIYISKLENRTFIQKIEVLEPGEGPVKPVRHYLDVSNAGFESDVVDGDIPGWTVDLLNQDTTLEVSQNFALSGDNSLHLLDQTTSGTARLISDLIEIEPGTEYTAGASVYIDGKVSNPAGGEFGTNQALLQVRYYDADGVQLPDYARLGIIYNLQDSWIQEEFSFTPHDEVKYIRVWITNAENRVSDSYFDDIYVFTEVDPEIIEVHELDDITVSYGTAKETIEFPSKVTVSLNSESEAELDVMWNDSEPVYDSETAGIYTFTGTLETEISNPEELVASIRVIVEEEVEEPSNSTLNELSEQLELYITAGDVRGPLVNQLQNSLRQANKHLDKGSEQKAADFVEKFLKHLNNKPMQKHVNEPAKVDLQTRADHLISGWKK